MSVLRSEEAQRGLTGEVEAYTRDKEKSPAMGEDVVASLCDRDDEAAPKTAIASELNKEASNLAPSLNRLARCFGSP